MVNRVWRWAIAAVLGMVLLGLGGCQTVNPAEGMLEITLWHGINPPANRAVFDQLVDQFNQGHDHIHLTALYVGQGDQQIPKIVTAVVGHAPPDILWYAPMLTGQLVELEALRPLDDWYATHPDIPLDPALEETTTLEGHRWSVPFGVNSVGLFYRPSLFADAGIINLPHTWDELRQVAQQLTTDQRSGMLLPLGQGEWTVFMWLSFLGSAGGDLLQEGHGVLDSPEAIAALQFWQDLISSGAATLSQPERGYELTDFLAGKVAMQLTGPWTLGELQQTGVDFAVMPIPQDRQPATAIGGETLFVFRTTPTREQAALEVLSFLVSEAAQTQWALGTGYLPVNLRSRQSLAYQTAIQDNPALQVFLDQASQGRSRPIVASYNRLSEQLGRAIEAVLLQTQSPEAALHEAQRRLERSP
jgi:multiple sugar transport system substrate-binding protein